MSSDDNRASESGKNDFQKFDFDHDGTSGGLHLGILGVTNDFFQ